MSALASSFECLECQELTSKIVDIETEIKKAKERLREAVAAADGTSARRYDELQELLKTESKLAAEARAHDQLGHPRCTELELTHNTVKA